MSPRHLALPVLLFLTTIAASAQGPSGSGGYGQKSADQIHEGALKSHRAYYQQVLQKIEEERNGSGQNLSLFIHTALVTAEVAGLDNQVKKHKEELLLLGTPTIFLSHLHKTEGWKGITEILKNLYCSDENTFEKDRLESLKKAYEFMAREYVISPKDEKTILLGFVLGVLKEIPPEHQTLIISSKEGQAVKELLDKKLTEKERLLALNPFQDLQLIHKYKTFLFEKKLKDPERIEPLVVKAATKSYLNLNQLNKARNAIQKIGDLKDKPDLAYTLATIHIEKGEFSKAKGLLKPVAVKDTESSLAKKAADLLALLDHQEDYLSRANATLSELLKAISAKIPESIYFKITGQISGKGTVEAHGRFNAPKDELEVVLIYKEQIALAYRADNSGTTFYFTDAPTIKKTKTKGMVIQFALTPKTDEKQGGFSFNSTEQGHGAIQKSLLSLGKFLIFQKDLLSAPLANLSGLPFLATDTVDGPKGKEFSLKMNNFQTGNFTTLQMGMDKNSLPRFLSWDKITLEVLSLDPAEGEKKIGSLWPKLPTEESDAIGASDWMRLIGTGISIMSDLYSETQKVKG